MMKKKTLLTALLLLLAAVLAFTLAACDDDEPVTLESLQNDYGVTVTGGGFTEGTTLTFRQVEATTEEGINILAAIDGQSYNKEEAVYIFEIYAMQNDQRVQPTERVEVALPRPAPVSILRQYLLFQVDESGGCSEILNPRFTKETVAFATNTLSYFVIAEKPHEHSYTQIEATASTCTEAGTVAHYHCNGCGKDFDLNYGEISSVSIPKASHDYGSMYWGKSANFWEDGNIAYYQCGECGHYFDEDYNEVETVVIPKYSANLSICVNGVPTSLVIEEQTDGHIVWTLEGLSVHAGDVITICGTDDPTVTHNFWGEGNVDSEGVIDDTAEAANVMLYASPNGLMLSISGDKYDGIVIEINGEQHPMNYVTYSDEQTTGYIYGLVNFAAGDKFVIVDNVSGTVYDYDDLCDSYNWNTWDYHRGDNGEFVIDNAGRYGIEFDGDETREIYIDKHFAPLDGGYYEVVLEGEERGETMQGLEAPKNSEVYEGVVWYYMQDSVMNVDDILAYIEEKGLHIYTVEMVLPAGAKLNIKTGAGTFITAEHLTSVNADEVCVTKEGDYVKILADGVYMITYLPAYNAFGIIKTDEALPDAYIYCNDGYLPLTKDASNVVTHEGLVAVANNYVIFMNGTKTECLPIILADGTDSTIAHVMENEGAYMLFFDKAGTYDLAYNVETGVLSITVADGNDQQGGNGGRDPSVTYGFYLITTDGAGGGGSYLLTVCDDNADEYCIKNFAITQGYFMNVWAIGNDQSTISYHELVDTDAALAQNVSTLIMICADGTYDIYFNTLTNTVRIVASAS